MAAISHRPTTGQRGKNEEKEVHRWLENVDRQLHHFDWLRLPDARTAMGRGTAMPGDFEFFYRNGHGLIEVKAVAHDFRLPVKNVTQLPRMRKRALAGGDCYILVHHTTSGQWRRIPATEMDLRDAGSWDLSGYPAYDSVAQALPLTLFGG